MRSEMNNFLEEKGFSFAVPEFKTVTRRNIFAYNWGDDEEDILDFFINIGFTLGKEWDMYFKLALLFQPTNIISQTNNTK